MIKNSFIDIWLVCAAIFVFWKSLKKKFINLSESTLCGVVAVINLLKKSIFLTMRPKNQFEDSSWPLLV